VTSLDHGSFLGSRLKNLVRAGICRLLLGILLGAVASILLGVFFGAREPYGYGVLHKNLLAGAITMLGAYLALSFVWLPTAIGFIVISLLVLPNYPRLTTNKPTIAVVLTISTMATAAILCFTVFPFSLLLLFVFIWSTVVPPVLISKLSAPLPKVQ
jgi:hypothetical protein